MYRIAKSFSFEASHQLAGLPDGHKCRRLHGHTYRIEVVLENSNLTDCGFVVDFADLAPVKAYLDTSLDHRHLNDVFDFAPTSENLAHHLYRWCRAELPCQVGGLVAAVRLSETGSTWAEFRPERAAGEGDR